MLRKLKENSCNTKDGQFSGFYGNKYRCSAVKCVLSLLPSHVHFTATAKQSQSKSLVKFATGIRQSKSIQLYKIGI